MSTVRNSELFGRKAIGYHRYRPDYPDNILSTIERVFDVSIEGHIAEFGAGTGKFTKHLIPHVRRITAIEPDEDMANVLKNEPAIRTNLDVCIATAEKTPLQSGSINNIFAAQSFHHFQPELAVKEFKRILVKGGAVFLIWYFSDLELPISSEILDFFYKFGEVLDQPKRLEISKKSLETYFKGMSVIHRNIDMTTQSLCREHFLQSMLSSSYAPRPGTKQYDQYISEANSIYNNFQINEEVRLHFQIHAYQIISGENDDTI